MGVRKNKGGSAKIRVEFKRNRNERTRVVDWTRRYQESLEDADFDAESSEERGEEENERPAKTHTAPNKVEASKYLRRAVRDDCDDSARGERVLAKGDATRKRTVVGTFVGSENLSGERGDFDVLPDVDLNVCRKGRVLRVHGLYSYVEAEDGRVYACLTRRVLKTLSTNQRQVVVAGDRVYFRDATLANGPLEGFVERVEPRYGVLSRTSWNRKHIVVANVEQALIVTSAAEPRLKPNLIDRLIVTCERSGIKPIICVNKVDLIDPASLQPFLGVYAKMGYRTIMFSAKTGFNLDRVRRALAGRESVVVGQSGVGKSSALNAVDSSLKLRTGAISQENQKGKHTTTTSRLLKLSFGGYVVDTPGVRQFMLWDFAPEEVVGYYRDLRVYENRCKFPNCTHTNEAMCAIKNAAADGRLDSRRYESYLALRSGEYDRLNDLE